jgi:hypothetical protein
LREDELRAMWRLRTSLLPLKPSVDPDQDYQRFRAFVDAAHVGRVLGSDGRPRAMISHQRIDGSFEGRRYRLALFEYIFTEASVRGHPASTFCYVRQLISCRRLGVANYFVAVGYPRSAVLMSRVLPDLRLDGDPSLTTLERHLVDQAVERVGGSQFDYARRVVELPTIPDPIRPEWRARHADVPIFTAIEARVPDWEQGRAAILIGRLDGSTVALGRELLRRLARPAGA